MTIQDFPIMRDTDFVAVISAENPVKLSDESYVIFHTWNRSLGDLPVFSLTSENGGLTIEGQRVLIRIPSSDLSELPEGVYQYALVSLERAWSAPSPMATFSWGILSTKTTVGGVATLSSEGGQA